MIIMEDASWLLLGLAGLAFFLAYMKFAGTKGTKALVAVGIIALVSITVTEGVWDATDPSDPLTVTPTGVTWITSAVSSGANVVKMSDYSFKILCTYDISDGALTAATDDATFVFTNTRGDTGITDATAIAKITNYGTKTNVTTDQTYAGIAKNADGSYNVIYTNSQSANTTTQIILPYDKTLGTDTFTLLLTPNVNAITAATLQDGVVVTMLNAGQVYTFEFIHYATQA